MSPPYFGWINGENLSAEPCSNRASPLGTLNEGYVFRATRVDSLFCIFQKRYDVATLSIWNSLRVHAGRRRSLSLLRMRYGRTFCHSAEGLRFVEHGDLWNSIECISEVRKYGIRYELLALSYRRLRGDPILTYALFEQGLANRFFTVDPANTRRGHGERQLLNDKNKTDPGNLGKSLAPVYQSVNPSTYLSSPDCLIDLFPLEYRRLRGDPILTYALFEQGLANSFSTLTQQTHGGDMTITDSHFVTCLREIRHEIAPYHILAFFKNENNIYRISYAKSTQSEIGNVVCAIILAAEVRVLVAYQVTVDVFTETGDEFAHPIQPRLDDASSFSDEKLANKFSKLSEQNNSYLTNNR
ncbi:hypothetical protein CLF_108916 [Clonorchis sinensis]|uniref:Uncharacterized protein n=1 Tax=Clonorchis sinensis TaxID=79923 RepID=G7YS11_CLOSI|nr:hypothetical protein CLF_108916 [Clonorchis sinensis]